MAYLHCVMAHLGGAKSKHLVFSHLALQWAQLGWSMIGETLGSYLVKEKIGEGGMGAVYLAVHPLIGRKVAVKMLRPEYSDNEDAVNRFFREARSTASLRHPALVDVFDYGVHSSGSAYIVMDYLEGESLESRLSKGRPPFHSTIDFTRQIAIGMSVAHAAGIIHRDLKPGNVFIEPDPSRRGGELLKILDFGIAKLTNREAGAGQATRTDIVMGTPLYMSPEQCRGAGGVDLRADIYSLGCILYEMLCGRLPFNYPWAGELIAAHLHEMPVAPRSIDPSIPVALEVIVLKALAKKPDDRQQTMDQVIGELDAYISTDPSWSAGIGSGPPPPMPGFAPRTPFPQAQTPLPHAQTPFPQSPNPSGPAHAAGPQTNAPSPQGERLPTMLITPDAMAGFAQQLGEHPGDPKAVNASTLSRGTATREVPLPHEVARQGKTVLLAIAGVVGALAILTAVIFLRRAPNDGTSRAAGGASTTEHPQPTAIATTEPPHENPVASAAPEPPPQPAESPPPDATDPPRSDTTTGAVPIVKPVAPLSDTIKVSITNGRKGLSVRVDGHAASLPVRLPRDGQTHELSFETPNFRPESRRVRADKDQVLVLENKPGFYVP